MLILWLIALSICIKLKRYKNESCDQKMLFHYRNNNCLNISKNWNFVQFLIKIYDKNGKADNEIFAEFN